MIVILGTSHVSRQSTKEVKEAIQQADVICIELDAGRAQGLLQDRQATFAELRQALGMKAAVMATIMRSVQQRLAKNVGVLPGAEMHAALKASMTYQKPVAFIDREIQITIRRLSKAFGWRETLRLFRDLFRPRRVSLHPSDEVVLELLNELKQHYPRIYKVMVSERDTYMAAALLAIQEQRPGKTILAVVGKGHVPGMHHQINYLNKEASVILWNSLGKSSLQS